MKTIYAIALLPIFAGAPAACDRTQPDASDVPRPASPLRSAGGPQPSFGPVVRQPEPPPPISGGTLVVSSDGKTAVAADPDRDRIYVVDLPTRTTRHTIALPRHSEPGRVTVDDDGQAYVALRRSGGLAVIDLATGTSTTRDVCVAPRGSAFDRNLRAVHVACASGELVTVPVSGGAMTRREIERDLRDVLVQRDGSLVVTTFRSAKTIHLWKEGPPTILPSRNGSNVAWRGISAPLDLTSDGCRSSTCDDATAIVDQRATAGTVSPGAGGYSGGGGFDESCGPATTIVTTQVRLGMGSIALPEAVLPVDLATNGRELVVVAAGNAFTKGLPQLFVVFASHVRASNGGCIVTVRGNVPGQAVAAAFDGDDQLVVQTREPAALHIMTEDRRRPWRTISLAEDSVADTGHALFHSNAGGFIACASCHAEGADDGHVWVFSGIGPRRTPSLLGSVAGTEPFHWDGDMKDLKDIVEHVFVERMSGPRVDAAQLEALGGWMFQLPEPPKLRVHTEATLRGEQLFVQRCQSCHTGGKLTNNRTVDVGTGGAFQVPSLVGVGWRQPLLHTGCAQTLTERFDPRCGGSKHGDTEDLSAADVSALVRFLETL